MFLAQRSFLLPTFWSLFPSIRETHSPSNLVPLLVRNCDPLEEQKHSGFGCFHRFCAGFFPSLWLYLPVVFVVGDFWMGSLSGQPFCWCWSYFLLFLSFPSNSHSALLQDCWRSTSDSACLGIMCRGCRTVRVAAGFFFCYHHPRRVPAWCWRELSFMRCLFGYTGVGELLEETVCPL